MFYDVLIFIIGAGFGAFACATYLWWEGRRHLRRSMRDQPPTYTGQPLPPPSPEGRQRFKEWEEEWPRYD